jgi:hypothetical protein
VGDERAGREKSGESEEVFHAGNHTQET